MKNYVQVLNSNSKVVGVTSADPVNTNPNITVYYEEYDKGSAWNSSSSYVVRNGIDDYGIVLLSEGVFLVELQKEACRKIMNTFQGENRDLIISGTLNVGHLNEMLGDAELSAVQRYCDLGLAAYAKGIIDAKVINATWFTQSRKDTYSSLLQEVIDIYG